MVQQSPSGTGSWRGHGRAEWERWRRYPLRVPLGLQERSGGLADQHGRSITDEGAARFEGLRQCGELA